MTNILRTFLQSQLEQKARPVEGWRLPWTYVDESAGAIRAAFLPRVSSFRVRQVQLRIVGRAFLAIYAFRWKVRRMGGYFLLSNADTVRAGATCMSHLP